jgi:hypothetical protein
MDVILQLLQSYYYGFVCAFGFKEFGQAGIYVDYGITSFFIISMLLEFITEVKEKGGEQPIRTFSGIGYHYISNGKFFIDLIQVIPYPLFLDIGDSNLKYLYFVRLYRLFEGLSVMNISNMMHYIKKYYQH